MQHWVEMAVTVICAVFASSGFWAWRQKKAEAKDAKTQMILGLGHDRIIHLCKYYIGQGWISTDDYENLYEYLYKPYELMGGNGTAKRLMNEVTGLPMRPPADTVPRKENFEE